MLASPPQATACGPELEAFIGCRCHIPRSQSAGQCSNLMCQGLKLHAAHGFLVLSFLHSTPHHDM